MANVFLECLFYDVKLDYQVPIISQQGEVGYFSNSQFIYIYRCIFCLYVHFTYVQLILIISILMTHYDIVGR